jgi:hypothetical protein
VTILIKILENVKERVIILSVCVNNADLGSPDVKVMISAPKYLLRPISIVIKILLVKRVSCPDMLDSVKEDELIRLIILRLVASLSASQANLWKITTAKTISRTIIKTLRCNYARS